VDDKPLIEDVLNQQQTRPPRLEFTLANSSPQPGPDKPRRRPGRPRPRWARLFGLIVLPVLAWILVILVILVATAAWRHLA
jgi:hypothetical protein